MILLLCTTCISLYRSLCSVKQRFVKAEKVLLSTQLEIERNTNLTDQRDHTVKVLTLFYCTALQNPQTLYIFLLNIFFGSLGLSH